MKSLIFLFIVLFSFSGCIYTGERVTGNGKLTAEQRDVKSFDKIKVTGSMDVILDVGTTSVTVEADENLLQYIITDMEGDELKISVRDHININTNNPMRVHVTSPNFSSIVLTGSSDISAKNKIESNEPVTYELTGSGNITVVQSSPRVKASITGSGNINLSGETKDVDVSITGSGNFEGLELYAENAKANIAGSGDIGISANTNLDANIMGSGDVKYKGNPSIHKSVAGSGSVNKVE